MFLLASVGEQEHLVGPFMTHTKLADAVAKEPHRKAQACP